MAQPRYKHELEKAKANLMNPDAYLMPSQASYNMLQLSQSSIAYVLGIKPYLFYRESRPGQKGYKERAAHIKRLNKIGSIALAPSLTIFGCFPDSNELCALPLVLNAEDVQGSIERGNADLIGHGTVSRSIADSPAPGAMRLDESATARGYSIRYRDKVTYVAQLYKPTEKDEIAFANMAHAIPEVRFVIKAGNDFKDFS